MHETDCVIKEIETLEKAAEYLCVVAMHPFAADFPRVLAHDLREIVANLSAPEDFVNRWLEKEWLTKAEGESCGTIG